MAAQKRPRKTTINSMLITAQSFETRPQPTMTLTEEEQSHFDRIIESREASTWMPHDLSVATQLARTMRRYDSLQRELDEDGLTLTNDKGTVVAHPLLGASMTMSSTIQALTRTLGLGASQRGLAGKVQKERNKADAAAREVIDKAASDSLIG